MDWDTVKGLIQDIGPFFEYYLFILKKTLVFFVIFTIISMIGCFKAQDVIFIKDYRGCRNDKYKCV